MHLNMKKLSVGHVLKNLVALDDSLFYIVCVDWDEGCIHLSSMVSVCHI